MSEHPQHEVPVEDAVAEAVDETEVTVVEIDECDVVEVDEDGTETVVEVVDGVTVAEVHPDGSATIVEVVEVDAITEDEDDAGDAAADERVEGLDDGSSTVGSRPEALPFTMSAREHFAAVDALEDTGDARVDAATARLAEVPDLPTADHVEVYEDVHKRLQDALAEAEVR